MSVRVAAVQLRVTGNRSDNLIRAAKLIDAAVAQGAQFVALPECFVGSYGVKHFAKWQESVPLQAPRAEEGIDGGAALMANAAQKHGVTVTGGIIEREDSGHALFNSMPVFGPCGSLLANYRKVHLSRVLGVTSESDVLTAGDECAFFDLPGDSTHRVGMACCFDLRFAAFLGQYGPYPSSPRQVERVDILCAPSAFLEATGGAHWDLLVRRAGLDLQSYVVAPNIAFDAADEVPLHGRSLIADPWGQVLAQCSAEGDDLAIADVCQKTIADVRGKIPLEVLAR